MSSDTIRYYTSEDTNFPTIDLTGKTAVIIRRSLVPNQELALHSPQQEQLVTFAKIVRQEETDENILLYTEAGAPGSQEHTTCLQEDITSGSIRSIIAERPDRLFRNEHALITTLLPKQRIVVIVPGKRFYDFSKEEDLQAFQTTTQEAHELIATHVKYMLHSRTQKKEQVSTPIPGSEE